MDLHSIFHRISLKLIQQLEQLELRKNFQKETIRSMLLELFLIQHQHHLFLQLMLSKTLHQVSVLT